jgi:hypothetical protein
VILDRLGTQKELGGGLPRHFAPREDHRDLELLRRELAHRAFVATARNLSGSFGAGTRAMNRTRRTQLTAPAPPSTRSAVTIVFLHHGSYGNSGYHASEQSETVGASGKHEGGNGAATRCSLTHAIFQVRNSNAT